IAFRPCGRQQTSPYRTRDACLRSPTSGSDLQSESCLSYDSKAAILVSRTSALARIRLTQVDSGYDEQRTAPRTIERHRRRSDYRLRFLTFPCVLVGAGNPCSAPQGTNQTVCFALVLPENSSGRAVPAERGDGF